MTSGKKKQNRQQRLSQQLRINLLRRKTQMRQRRRREALSECESEPNKGKTSLDK